MATGYLPHPYEDRPEPAGHTPTNGVAAAAGLYTTVTDLAKWLCFQLTAAPAAVGLGASPTDDEVGPDKKAVLRPRSLDEMHTPQAIDPDWTEARCLGWFGRRRGETVVIGHGGSIHGFITQVYFHKASKTGVVLLTNEGRHTHAANAALDVLDLVIAEQKAQTPSRGDAPPPPTPPELRRFLGRYQLWMGSLVHLEYRDGALHLVPAPPDKVALHAPTKLAPTDDPLVWRATQARAAGELLRFTARRPAKGQKESETPITGFTLSGFKYTKLS
ncbi:MAG TPA: serine hydrolase, partial [Chloroflexota bacterium]|nr:serine hydrolase [Chloroflexota bacterium]